MIRGLAVPRQACWEAGNSRAGKRPWSLLPWRSGAVEPGAPRMAVIPDFKSTTLMAFLKQNVAPGSTVYTDGLKSFTVEKRGRGTGRAPHGGHPGLQEHNSDGLPETKRGPRFHGIHRRSQELHH